MTDLEKEVVNILIALDELGNAVTGGNPRHTISYRMAKLAQAGSSIGIEFCKLIGEIDPNHCQKAIEDEGG